MRYEFRIGLDQAAFNSLKGQKARAAGGVIRDGRDTPWFLCIPLSADYSINQTRQEGR